MLSGELMIAFLCTGHVTDGYSVKYGMTLSLSRMEIIVIDGVDKTMML